MEPMTEDDIANYLANTPDFFARHAELLASVQLNSPHGNRAVSLQERQAEMLREKIKLLEQRLMDMLRHGNENTAIAQRLLRWAGMLFLVQDAAALPDAIATSLASEFQVPQVAIKVWGVHPRYSTQPFALGVSDDAKTFASSLSQPYCGVNAGFEATQWLEHPYQAMSLALVALRGSGHTAAQPALGMLVLASPDPQRFHGNLGTEFLERIAQLASAALSRLGQD
jgi:uncharacterized protein